MYYNIDNFGKQKNMTTGNLALVERVEELKKTRRTNEKKHRPAYSQEVFSFKLLEDIEKMKNYFLSKKRYRDYALFVIGINLSLRCGDLLKFTWKMLYRGNRIIDFKLKEQKTGKGRLIHLNKEARDALELLRQHTPTPTGYVFTSQRSNKLTVRGARAMLKKAAAACEIPFNVGTHSMRKTWGYHQFQKHKNDATILLRLQRAFNHSHPKITERYIGIDDDMMIEMYDSIGL